jgi:hypothetical protein
MLLLQGLSRRIRVAENALQPRQGLSSTRGEKIMITRLYGEWCITCDECGENFFGGVLEWTDFWAECKESGWSAHKDGDEWQHCCNSCEEE